ncbi:MAG: hypothetical protein KME45_24725 [Stenomitos rutilans HA7619-LM2]|jgi:hypothetical protein|nr:hypothetical protein [Stenomitos rutilans HA7619-LM2]
MMIETLEKQDGRPHVVLDPLMASELASAIQAPLLLPATAQVGVGGANCKSHAMVTEKTLLLQRMERLEAITTKLAQRLAVLEQGSLPPRAPPLQPYPTNPHQPCPEPSQGVHQADTRPLARSPAESNKAQSVAVASASSPNQPLVTLAPKDWTRGLVTRQLVERLQTNPTTLKKYLRELKQPQWAVERDPEGFGWVYNPPLQCYYPLRLESDAHPPLKSVLTVAADIEALCEPLRSRPLEQPHASDLVEQQTEVGTGGLSQSALSRLTGIPITTLQQWKQLPDCAERMRCRTEGRYCYWYARQTKRFYPLNSPTGHAFGVVTATEI